MKTLPGKDSRALKARPAAVPQTAAAKQSSPVENATFTPPKPKWRSSVSAASESTLSHLVYGISSTEVLAESSDVGMG